MICPLCKKQMENMSESVKLCRDCNVMHFDFKVQKVQGKDKDNQKYAYDQVSPV